MGSDDDASDAASLDEWPDVSDEEEWDGSTSVDANVKDDGIEEETTQIEKEAGAADVVEDSRHDAEDAEEEPRETKKDNPEEEPCDEERLTNDTQHRKPDESFQRDFAEDEHVETSVDDVGAAVDGHVDDRDGETKAAPTGCEEGAVEGSGYPAEPTQQEEAKEAPIPLQEDVDIVQAKMFDEPAAENAVASESETTSIPLAAEEGTCPEHGGNQTSEEKESGDEQEHEAGTEERAGQDQTETKDNAQPKDTHSVPEGESQSLVSGTAVEDPHIVPAEPEPQQVFDTHHSSKMSGLHDDDIWNESGSVEDDGWDELGSEEIQATTAQEEGGWGGWGVYSTGLASSIASVATGVGGALREVGQGMVEDITAVASSTHESTEDSAPTQSMAAKKSVEDLHDSRSQDTKDKEKTISSIFDRLHLQDQSESEDFERKLEDFSHNVSSKFSSVWSWGGGALKNAASSFSSEVRAGLAEFQGAAKLAGSRAASGVAGERIQGVSRAVSEHGQETLGYMSSKTKELLQQQDGGGSSQSMSLRYFNDFFQVSGGERAMEDVESISHSCTLKCNKARGNMLSKAKHDTCLQKLQDILNLDLDEEIAFTSQKALQFPGNGLHLVSMCQTEAQQEALARIEDAEQFCENVRVAEAVPNFDNSEEQSMLLDLKISGVEQLSEVLMLSMKRLLSLSKDIQQRDLVDSPEQDVLDVAFALRTECLRMLEAINQVTQAYSSALSEVRELFIYSAKKTSSLAVPPSEDGEGASSNDLLDIFVSNMGRFVEDMTIELHQDSRTCRSHLQDVALHLTYVVLYTTVAIP